jgi:hypothetical protein
VVHTGPGSEEPADGVPVPAVVAAVITVAVAGWAIPFGGLALALLYALTGLRRNRIGIVLMLLIGAAFALNAVHVFTTDTDRLPVGPIGTVVPGS